ncbi:unnamed protein product [Cylindrotheca closterium]|uniref:Disease resistance R13L4/SHOC-2-like LRR domain-containing protein n=1 Tax=Cylindrotheca closterium TaxID=2856 RepID=A0AAD2JI78_9STRA|nr:unnamed protein product [Cylindrotheca closterium]
MDTPKANNKAFPLDSSPLDPDGDKECSDAQTAAKKLDDLIEGQRKNSAGKRLERQQSRRISSFPSHRSLNDASPIMTFRKLSPSLYYGNVKNPPSDDSNQAPPSGKKDHSDKREPTRMSTTSKKLQLDLEAKARARGLRSSPSVRNIGASSPSVLTAGAKKAPPPQPGVNHNQTSLSGPGRKLSFGESQPSRIPHFVPSRLQSSKVELEMGELNSSSHDGVAASRGKHIDSKRPGLVSQSNSVRRLPAPSFRRNTFARASSMTAIRHSATSNSVDLDQLIAYKTGIPLENLNEEESADKKPAAEPSASSRAKDFNDDDNASSLPSPQASYSAAPPRPLMTSVSGMTNNRDLDELIAYKTGIPLQCSTGKETGEEVAPAVEKDKVVKYGNFPNQMTKRPADPEGIGSLGGTDAEWAEDEDLAIAIEVQEDIDEDAFIPSAIQYGPDAKMPIYKNCRFRFYCALLFGIAAVAMIAGVISFVQSQRDPISDEESPSEPTEAQSIKSIIELIVGREKLEDRDTPYYAALDWIANIDKSKVGVEDRLRLIQRYVLALFHFQTSNWYSCGAANNTVVDGEDGCLYQELVSYFPHRYRSLPSYRWLSSRHECEWAGVRCGDSDYVTNVILVGQKIRGNLPKEFTELEGLDALALQWNDLTGTIPEEYGKMKRLGSFQVHYNQLTGTLPKSFFVGMRNLFLVNVGQNFLTGTIPLSFKNMVGLRGLYLFNNLFRGEIPSEIGELSLLNFIHLDKNFLTGTLPTTLGRLNLEELFISRQDISGPIPSELGNIHRINAIDFHSTSLNGTLPEELYNMTDLQILDLHDTKLSGTLSSKIGRLTDLRALRINDSRLSSSIPTELGNLSRLSELWMNGNYFDCAVPSEVCSLKELESLKVVTADCLPMDESGIAQVSCDCCDTCCNPESKACKLVGE